MPNQVIRPATEVMFWNQVKTVLEPAVTPMKARKEKATETRRAVHGRPLRLVRLKILGAFPATARPSMAVRNGCCSYLFPVLYIEEVLTESTRASVHIT